MLTNVQVCSSFWILSSSSWLNVNNCLKVCPGHRAVHVREQQQEVMYVWFPDQCIWSLTVWCRVTVPPATSPDSPSWMATPNPPSFTGAEFSLDASSTQWGWGQRRTRETHEFMLFFLLIEEWHPLINNTNHMCETHPDPKPPKPPPPHTGTEGVGGS